MLLQAEEEVSIIVKGEGDGFDSKAPPDPTAPGAIELSHGRGIYLMKAFMDEVRFEQSGAVVHKEVLQHPTWPAEGGVMKATIPTAIATVHFRFGLFMDWFGSREGLGIEYHLLAIVLALVVVVKGWGSVLVGRSCPPTCFTIGTVRSKQVIGHHPLVRVIQKKKTKSPIPFTIGSDRRIQDLKENIERRYRDRLSPKLRPY